MRTTGDICYDPHKLKSLGILADVKENSSIDINNTDIKLLWKLDQLEQGKVYKTQLQAIVTLVNEEEQSTSIRAINLFHTAQIINVLDNLQLNLRGLCSDAQDSRRI